VTPTLLHYLPLQYTWMGGEINRARKRLNVPYPNLYAPPGARRPSGSSLPALSAEPPVFGVLLMYVVFQPPLA